MRLIASIAAAFMVLAAWSGSALADENTVVMETQPGQGDDPACCPILHPNMSSRSRRSSSKGFYDGIVFHRVIEGFMAQTGDPTGTGMGGSTCRIFLPNSAPNRSSAAWSAWPVRRIPNSANSQFFIMFADGEFLNGQYTVIGKVTEGMDVVDKIKRATQARTARSTDPTRSSRCKCSEPDDNDQQGKERL